MSAANPLFPDDNTPDQTSDGYLLSKKSGQVEPLETKLPDGSDAAADMIRQKLSKIYAEEPNATEEIAESKEAKPRSKHQQFMFELSRSGKGLADIQTEWHNYYVSLPDEEKHEVWREFYESNEHSAYFSHPATKHIERPTPPETTPKKETFVSNVEPESTIEKRSTAAIRRSLRQRVSANGKLTAKHHLQSLAFGLGAGFLVIFIFLFGFFNEMFITPFIQPGRTAADTPIILSSDATAPTAEPEVIIPKINVEIPVDYTQTSTDENVIENALMNGVVHYPNTVMPGQTGNAAFFGHSSNNIFNQGKYKFAFVLLHTLVPGDTFYLTNGGKIYAYKVISKTIVDPSDVGVLGSVPGQTATATLITCDPPGTSLHRLVVVGQQVSPDPSKNTAAPTPVASAPVQLASNGPTLWSRVTATLYGKLLVAAAAGLLLAIAGWTWRQWR